MYEVLLFKDLLRCASLINNKPTSFVWIRNMFILFTVCLHKKNFVAQFQLLATSLLVLLIPSAAIYRLNYWLIIEEILLLQISVNVSMSFLRPVDKYNRVHGVYVLVSTRMGNSHRSFASLCVIGFDRKVRYTLCMK